MGTFTFHFVPGLAFTLLGLWHTLNTTRAYRLKAPSNFASTTWFPFPSPIPTLRRLELYLLLSFALLAIAVNLLDYPFLTFSFKPDSCEHATVFLHLAIYSAVALAVDLSGAAEALRGLVGALAASFFAQELFLLHFHSTDHVGLEGHYHWLLQLTVALSLLATGATAGLPSSFLAAIVRSVSVLLQGLWSLVMAFALWVPRLVPKGCYPAGAEGDRDVTRGAVACATEEASRRAMALANLQFSWTLAGVSIFLAYLCLRPDWKSVEYRQLRPGGVDGSQVSGESEGIKQVHAPV